MTLPATLPRLPARDHGFTLVELMVALFGVVLVSVVMLSVFVATNRADRHHEADDRAMAELRTVLELITKDLRRSEQLVVADAKSVTLWIDESRDRTADPGETITWTIESDGAVSRSTDGGTYGVLAGGMSYADSNFGYDSVYPYQVRRVTVNLAAFVRSPGVDGARYVATEVFIRNGS